MRLRYRYISRSFNVHQNRYILDKIQTLTYLDLPSSKLRNDKNSFLYKNFEISRNSYDANNSNLFIKHNLCTEKKGVNKDFNSTPENIS